jgi:hypothetical protein
VSSRSFGIHPVPPTPKIKFRGERPTSRALATATGNTLNWRYIVGAFQVKVPVTTAADILPDEENALAIFRWRLGLMSPTNRWYPVLERYINYISARVNGLGGNSANIPPSPTGAPISEGQECEICGKVCELLFDSCGRFEGFIIDCHSEKHTIKSCQKAVMELALRVCKEQLLVCVRIHRHGKDERILKIKIRPGE